MPERKLLSEKECKEKITWILGNIHSPRQLSLIYRFAQSLYIHD